MNTEEMIQNKIGEVRVADDVLLSITGLAATEVDGVSFLGKNIGYDEIVKAGKGLLSKHIEVNKKEDGAEISVEITVNGLIPLPEVSKKVEEHVTGTINAMIGLPVSKVIVKIVGVA